MFKFNLLSKGAKLLEITHGIDKAKPTLINIGYINLVNINFKSIFLNPF